MEARVCTACGESNPAQARLCGMCRTAVVAEDASAGTGKLVTVVTSDLKGSTALGERLDPESLREVLNRYFSVMRVVFESHGGSIEKIIGDAIVAVFGLPFRHDDDPIRAAEAAAETQRALVTLNDELDQLWGVRLVNRTGVATGIVHFGRDAEGQHVLIGETMDESTAMEQNAPPVEVLMAESTYRELRDLVDAEDMGFKSPKGSDLQIHSYRLAAVHARPVAEEDAAPPEPAPGMRACQVCGEESPAHYRYCVTCGASAATIAARDSRKTVTIVFANPKPHTESGEPLEPTAFTDVMTRYFEAMKVALERHGGTVEKFIGDAVMAVFGLPVRHEDDALRAVRAAADMQAALPALNAAFGQEYGVRLLNHIGVNTGEVIATGDASTGQRLVTGDAVNTAARLEQAAGAAEIILGELTHRLIRDHVEVEAIAPLALKGKTEPVPAYRFVRVRQRPVDTTASATPFVGREAEMGRLSEALRTAAEGDRARLVTVVGDAGVGKSRLIREFARTAGAEAQVYRGRCLPYGDGITFWPLAEVVREAAIIEADDSPDAAIEKIRGLLTDPLLAAEREAVTDRVAAMIGVSATRYPVAELMWGIRRLLEAMAAARPLVMIVDDIHWAEQTFLDVIDHLIEAVEGATVLVLCTARHELRERYADWAGAHAAETITLVPLSDTETGDLVAKLLGELDPGVRARISEAAEGNPLYTEQIVSLLQETGAIRREGERWVATRASGELAIPPTVQALVAARLDVLDAEERAVIEPASVIGLSFAGEAIAELVETEILARLEVELGSLTAKQLIRRAGGDEGLYRFGHIVIKDTAYGSLLKRIRAALHERFVVWAERVNKERGRETEFEEILGYHLEQAYRYRIELAVIDDEARAVGRRAAAKLASAGRRAFGRGDAPAAANLLRRGTALLPALDPERIELLTEAAEAEIEQGEFDAASTVLGEARASAESIGDPRLEAREALVRYQLAYTTTGSVGDIRTVIAEANEMMSIFEASGDRNGLTRAWRLLWVIHGTAGDLEAAANAASRVADIASEIDDHRLAARAAIAYSQAALESQMPVPEALERCEALLGAVRLDRIAEARFLPILGVLHAMQGDFEEARRLYRRSHELVAELGRNMTVAALSQESSRIELLAGDPAAAEQELRRDYATLEAVDERYIRSTIAGLLGHTLLELGRDGEADRFVTIASELAGEDDVFSQVLWRTARARLSARDGRFDEAIALAGNAVEKVSQGGYIEQEADARLYLAEILGLAGRRDGQEQALTAAGALYARKGDETMSRLVQGRLGALLSRP